MTKHIKLIRRQTTEIRHRTSGGEFRMLVVYEPDTDHHNRVSVMVGDGELKVSDVQEAYKNDRELSSKLRHSLKRSRWYTNILRDDALELLKVWQGRCDLDGFDCIITTIIRKERDDESRGNATEGYPS